MRLPRSLLPRTWFRRPPRAALVGFALGLGLGTVGALGAAGITGAGAWLRSAVAAARAPAQADAAAPAAGEAPRGDAPSCVDARAMHANAKLVGDAQLCHAAVAEARAEATRARALATSRQRSASTLAEDLAMSRDDWTAAARSGAVVLRVPCASPRQRPTAEIVRPQTRRLGVSAAQGDKAVRAEAAGLNPEELDALEQAYVRAHARTWAKMQASCAEVERRVLEESSPELRHDPSERDGDTTPYERLAECRAMVASRLDRAHVARLAEVRSAGLAAERGESAAERVVLALVESTEELARAMTDMLGAEKAARAVAFGLTCTNETFIFTPAPRRDDGPT